MNTQLHTPRHHTQLRRASNQLLAALQREHPHIITCLTRVKEPSSHA
jgi:hypothetical protein